MGGSSAPLPAVEAAMVEEAGHILQLMQRATQYADAATMALTVAYCAMVAHDVAQPDASAARRFSSSTWFSRGFCLAKSTHLYCFVVDVTAGSLLLLLNAYRYLRTRASTLWLPTVAAAFTVLHGLGHVTLQGGAFGVEIKPFGVELAGDADFMSHLRPSELGVFSRAFAAYYAALFSFLGVGPVLGYYAGRMRPSACLALHSAVTLAFLAYVPTQFAFGAVQLVLNGWYCAPRLLWPSHCPHGPLWLTSSVGLVLLMPVVFAEMLLCDRGWRWLGGHALYDGSTVVLTAVASAVAWHARPHSAAGGGSDKKRK